MRYKSAAAFRRALEARLANLSDERGLSLVRLRKLVAFDRFLVRLAVVSPDGWRLKGALALEYRFGNRSRATMDVDIELRHSPPALVDQLIATQEIALDDRFVIRQVKAGPSRGDDFEGTRRFRFETELAGRLFEPIRLDVGPPGPAAIRQPKAEILAGPELLGFAGIPPARVAVISLEQHLAEKLHAYTRSFPGGRRSNRPKDLVDILLIRRLAKLSAGQLQRELEQAFRDRTMNARPRRLPQPPDDWETAFEMLAGRVGVEKDIDAACEAAAAFLDPILQGLEDGDWDPRRGEWITGP